MHTHTQPHCFPAAEVEANNAPGQETVAYGYGDTKNKGPMSASLLQTSPGMAIVPELECRKVRICMRGPLGRIAVCVCVCAVRAGESADRD